MEDQLLEALRMGDEDRINELACKMFITNDGHHNRVEISKFEKYAPCRIFPLEKDSFGWLIGGINYNGTIYSFG